MNYELKKFKELKRDYDYFVIGADVGGTNTRIAIAGVSDKPDLLFSLNFKTNELKSIIPALNFTLKYCKDKFNFSIENAVIGASGIISPLKDCISLTNANWKISHEEILNKTNLSSIKILNDFQLVGFGLNLIDENKDILVVRENNKISKETTKAIIGAGTGLGKTILYYDSSKKIYIPLPTEGGHSDFPIQNKYEEKLVEFIKKQRKIKTSISYEDLLSGRGLENIYNFIRHNEEFEESKFTKEVNNAKDKAQIISKYKNIDVTCKKTFELFAKFYGRCAKNFVLDTLSFGGLYMAGGIASKSKDIFRTKHFIDEFEKSEVRKDFLKNIPIYVILNYDISLFGACFAATID